MRVRECRAVDPEGGYFGEHAREWRGCVGAKRRPLEIAQLHGSEVGERGAAWEEHVRSAGVLEGEVGGIHRDGAELFAVRGRRVEAGQEGGGGAR